jgi:hypothetical protein
MQCQVCNAEMRQIPAGISKSTGKPYQSFMACPNKCKQPRPEYNPSTFTKFVAKPEYVPTPTEQPDWDGINQKKTDDIRANVALKMTSEIIAAGIVPINEWKKWTDEFYSYQPKDSNPFI